MVDRDLCAAKRTWPRLLTIIPQGGFCMAVCSAVLNGLLSLDRPQSRHTFCFPFHARPFSILLLQPAPRRERKANSFHISTSRGVSFAPQTVILRSYVPSFPEKRQFLPLFYVTRQGLAIDALPSVAACSRFHHCKRFPIRFSKSAVVVLHTVTARSKEKG